MQYMSEPENLNSLLASHSYKEDSNILPFVQSACKQDN
jgi:hypothetical protein